MANKRDIKRRIESVANTQKITKAMKLVSAAKFSRAVQAVHAARPYGIAFDTMLAKILLDLEVPESLFPTTGSKDLVVVMSTDRGLCGALNANIFKRAFTFQNADFIAWGRKASQALRKSGCLIQQKEKIFERPDFGKAKVLVEELVDLSKNYKSLKLIAPKFINAISQEVVCLDLLPLKSQNQVLQSRGSVLVIEPEDPKMLDRVVKRKLHQVVFQAMLEAVASEHGARMTAMDNASRNASEVRKKLTLKYNRARQAAITKELIEIISGAEAV